eukprot:CAMPEP_0119042720 /NCGR_PEP_ID=MMETSP1177-20130426/16109_1 /TAXON_ID=2985 /ORGANISM="Ochromonas sp, Strain CCMP1899" /LENGTH=419 /DNA_ID=CAMNT_0007009703 /DNA_START=568 /DNA_END=1827 /DNA_ORIENTATION=-
MSNTDSSEEKAPGVTSIPFSSPSPASACHSTPSTSGSTASSWGSKKEVNVPLSSITDRAEIEKEIQGIRLRFSDDQPPPIPRSSRSNHSRGGEYNDLSRTFARRNYLSSESEYNTSRGTMNDLEHAALRLRFAVAIGERSHGIFRHPNEGMDRGRDHNSMAEYLESRVVGRRSHNDLERIEEMMMMEAIRQSMAETETPSNIPANSSNADETSMTNIDSTKSGGTSEETSPKTSNKVSACSSLLSDDLHSCDKSPNDHENNGQMKGFDNTADICDVGILTTENNLHGNLSDSESDIGDSSCANSEQLEIDEENEQKARSNMEDGTKSVEDEITAGIVIGNKNITVNQECDLEGLKSDNLNGNVGSLTLNEHLSVSSVLQPPLAGDDNPTEVDGSPSLELLRKIEIALGKSAVGDNNSLP